MRWRDYCALRLDIPSYRVWPFREAQFSLTQYGVRDTAGGDYPIQDLDTVLAVVAGECGAQNIDGRLVVSVHASMRSPLISTAVRSETLIVKPGWLEVELATIRQWVTHFNLTQSWDHVDNYLKAVGARKHDPAYHPGL